MAWAPILTVQKKQGWQPILSVKPPAKPVAPGSPVTHGLGGFGATQTSTPQANLYQQKAPNFQTLSGENVHVPPTAPAQFAKLNPNPGQSLGVASNDAAKFVASIPQAIPRAGAALAATAVERFTGQPAPAVTPQSPAARTLLGSEPITSYQQQGTGVSQYLEQAGFTPGFSDIAASVGVAGMAVADMSPFGGRASFVTKLKNATDPASVANLMAQAKFSPDIIAKYAPDLARLSETKDIQKALDAAASLQSNPKRVTPQQPVPIKPSAAPAPTKATPENIRQAANDNVKTAINEKRAVVIDPDGLKKTFNDYDPKNHELYSRAANDNYREALSQVPNPVVKFTAGGSGSGKSELLLKKITPDFDGIVVDKTLSSYDSARKQINEALAAGKTVEINAILPRIESAWKFTQKREVATGRGVPLEAFVDRHVGFVETLKQLIKDGDVHIRLKDTREKFTTREAADAPFITDKSKILAALNSLSYSKDKLIRELQDVKLSEKSRRKTIAKRELRLRGGDSASQSTLSRGRGGDVYVDGGRGAAGPLRAGDDPRGSDRVLHENARGEAVAASRTTRESPLGEASGQAPVRTSSRTAEQSLPSPEPAPLKSLSLANDADKLAIDASINVNNLRLTNDGKQVVNQTVAELSHILEAKLGRTLSNKETVELADNTSKVLTRAVGREQTLDWQAAMLKTRQSMTAAAETGRIDKDFLQNLITVKTQGTDIARKLQSLSIKADPKETTNMQTIVDAVLDTTNNAEEILRAAEGVDFNDFRQASAFFRKFVKPKMGEWIDMVRYNSMLSSPLTHFVNAFSNAINSSLVAPIEKAVTGGLDWIGAAVTGRERRYFAGESASYIAAYFGNIKEATSNFAGALSGRRAATNLDTRHIPVAVGGVKGAVASTLSVPMRVLEASDQFFTALTQAGEMAALTKRASKGVATPTAAVTAADKAAYRLFRQDIFSEEQGKLLDAVDQLTNLVQMMRTNKNPIIANIGKFTVPFIRTPMNIFKQGIEYSPFGYLTLLGAANKTEQLSKAVIGSAVFAGAATLLMSNRLTWAEPISEADRNAFRASGMLPYSVKIGDTWVQYQKLPPPVAFPMAMIALLDDAQKSKKIDQSTVEMILSTISKYGSFLADQSYAKSVGDLMAAVKGGESDWARVFGNIPQQLIPYRALGGWLSRLIDDVQRKPDPDGTFIEKQVQLMMMNIPGLSDNVPARTDSAGNEIKAPNNEINAISPVRVSTENPEAKAEFQMMQEIRKLERDATTKNNILKDQAEATWAEISELPREEMIARLKEMKTANPALHDKVVDVGEADRLELTATEKVLKSATVATRAQLILDELNATKTPEERKALVEKYKKKKILTDAVADRIRELKNQ